MLRPIDDYFLRHAEPIKSCLQFLREHILTYDKNISEAWKYGMPFFCYKGKMFCYLWTHKKLGQPYIGVVEGSLIHDKDFITEKRARMKILLIDPAKNIPLKKIDVVLKIIIAHYKQQQ